MKLYRPSTRRFALAASAAVLAAWPPRSAASRHPGAAARRPTDQFDGSNRTVTQSGTAGNDTLTVTVNNAVVEALGGNDIVRVGPNVSGVTICLGDGDDTVTGNGGAPNRALSVMGGPGSDSITAGSGNDVLNGGTGFDFIDAGAGSDICKNVETAAGCGARYRTDPDRHLACPGPATRRAGQLTARPPLALIAESSRAAAVESGAAASLLVPSPRSFIGSLGNAVGLAGT